MLIDCPECKKEISHYARTCPYCGLPYINSLDAILSKDKQKIEIEKEGNPVKPDQDFLDFELERIKLAFECSEKDSYGKPFTQNGAFVIVEKLDAFEKEMNKLKKKYKNAIEKRDLQLKEWKMEEGR